MKKQMQEQGKISGGQKNLNEMELIGKEQQDKHLQIRVKMTGPADKNHLS